MGKYRNVKSNRFLENSEGMVRAGHHCSICLQDVVFVLFFGGGGGRASY